INKTALATGENVVAQLGGAGYSHVRGQQTMLPDSYVVRDLDKVIDLGSLANDGLAKGRTIDGRPGTDLHIILNSDNAHLWNLVMSAFMRNKTVSVRADHGARVNDAAIPDPRSIVDYDIGIDDCFVADDNV